MYSIESIKAKPLQTQVYTSLKEKLIHGVWKEGEKLPSEHEFCAMFGVSRVTIRAAIQQLSILGLVETRQGEGTFVKNFSLAGNLDALHPLIQIQQNQDLITVMEYRKIIEKGTIGLALEKITEDDFAALEKTYDIMTGEFCSDEALIQADFGFHYELAQISKNSMIIKIYELLHQILFVAMHDIVFLAGRTGSMWHRRIIDTLKRGNKAECEAVMEEHIQKNIEVIQENMGRKP